MSFFGRLNNMFGSKGDASSKMDWQKLSVEEDVEHLISASSEKPQILYKHSTRCATSYFALKNIEMLSPLEKQQADFYMVDVIGQRPLSMYIADMLGIRHESPQLFVFKNGEVSWHGSHNQIQTDVIRTLI
jgi:bacillithiol system protein YtxJ